MAEQSKEASLTEDISLVEAPKSTDVTLTVNTTVSLVSFIDLIQTLSYPRRRLIATALIADNLDLLADILSQLSDEDFKKVMGKYYV